jgi:hypothetical protein
LAEVLVVAEVAVAAVVVVLVVAAHAWSVAAAERAEITPAWHQSELAVEQEPVSAQIAVLAGPVVVACYLASHPKRRHQILLASSILVPEAFERETVGAPQASVPAPH